MTRVGMKIFCYKECLAQCKGEIQKRWQHQSAVKLGHKSSASTLKLYTGDHEVALLEGNLRD